MKRYTHYIHTALIAASLLMPAAAQAQQPDNSFKVMTLNVDGLPAKLLFFDVNPDGPASAGSELISEYIAARSCDIVALQEDFNYRWEIWSRLFAGYNHDEWAGGVLTEECKVDYAHLHRNKFPTDGLNMSWKKECQSTAYDRVAWKQAFGKFSHNFDDMITKGFRRHEITLQNGIGVVVYNLHMDASSDRDEQVGNDVKDRAARASQWEQLRDYIMNSLDLRPVIVLGDMNTLYHRDNVKALFIDNINQSGKATAGDVWVELQRSGIYPAYGQTEVKDDMYDKVIYINPQGTPTPISPKQVEWDKNGYLKEDGTPLGDHYPVIATFTVSGTTAASPATTIDLTQKSLLENAPAYTLQGTLATPDRNGLLIKEGKKYIKK